VTHKVTGFIKRNEIITFVFITFLCSWFIWGILYSSYMGIIDRNLYRKHIELIIDLGILIPSSVSIFLTGYLYKKKGLKELLVRLTKWKFSPIYYIFVICYWTFACHISLLICNFIGYKSQVHFFTNPYYILIYSIITLFLGGSLGEEIGWRGFLLPRLQRKLNPFCASIIIGIIWACWHLPLFFINGSTQYGSSFLLFLFIVIGYSIPITWVYNRTDGSLIFPILFHVSTDITIGLIYGQKFKNLQIHIFCIVQLIIIIFIICDIFRNKSNKVVNTNDYVL
jgi:membrane protease YdiL (CAAX protease family)